MGAVQALNRLCKWRTVFAGWQLGTRPDTDPECRAVRDAIDARLVLRAEVSAITGILFEKGIITEAEWDRSVEREANILSDQLAKQFPGFTATDEGIAMDIVRARETMRGWKP